VSAIRCNPCAFERCPAALGTDLSVLLFAGGAGWERAAVTGATCHGRNRDGDGGARYDRASCRGRLTLTSEAASKLLHGADDTEQYARKR
jgi:hypothetical protein